MFPTLPHTEILISNTSFLLLNNQDKARVSKGGLDLSKGFTQLPAYSSYHGTNWDGAGFRPDYNNAAMEPALEVNEVKSKNKDKPNCEFLPLCLLHLVIELLLTDIYICV